MADTHNIYQRAIDIFNKHVEPDISQGGGGGSGGPQYAHRIMLYVLDNKTEFIKFGKETSDRKECKMLVLVSLNVITPFEDAINDFETLSAMVAKGIIPIVTEGRVEACDKDSMSTKYAEFKVTNIGYEENDGDRLNFYYPIFDWDKGQIGYTYTQLIGTEQMQIVDMVQRVFDGEPPEDEEDY